MSNACLSWVETTLPKAQIVYDHFHVIKAMIEKMDHVRRREMAKLDDQAKTVERHLSGILGYWDFDHASSGSAEGFNTKIRLLIKQSYGIRDFKYLRLKIHALPSRRIKTHI